MQPVLPVFPVKFLRTVRATVRSLVGMKSRVNVKRRFSMEHFQAHFTLVSESGMGNSYMICECVSFFVLFTAVDADERLLN